MRSDSSPLRRQQDDRDPRPAGLAQQAHDLEPVDPGKHEVEHDEVGVPGRRARQRGVPVAGDPRLVARALEIARDDLGDRGLVVDDEDAAAAGVAHTRMIAFRAA